MLQSPVSEERWLVTSATVAGKSHDDGKLPNQDHVSTLTARGGRVIAAVVSDGAGTAAHADVGSSIACSVMAPWILQIGCDMLDAPGLDDDLVRERVIEGIECVRSNLAADGKALRDHHCTLVACVIADHRAYVCQVGDSIAITTTFEERSNGSEGMVDFFPDKSVRLFDAERGEYANETHFITEADWQTHLRVTSVGMSKIDALLLMTDGAMDVALTGGKVYRGFLSALISSLLGTVTREARDGLLQRFLGDPRTYVVTGDDKTMFIAARAAQRRLVGRKILMDEEDEPVAGRKGGGNEDTASGDEARALLVPTIQTRRPLLGGWITATAVFCIGIGVGALGATVTPAMARQWFAHAVPRPHMIREGIARVFPGSSKPTASAAALSAAIPKKATASAASANPPKATASAAETPADVDAPARRAPIPAEVLVLPALPELVLRVGRSTDVTLRLVSGENVQIKSVAVPDGSHLQVEQGDPPCEPEKKLTPSATSCVLTVKAGAKARPGKHLLIVSFVDLATKQRREVRLPVLLSKAAS